MYSVLAAQISPVYRVLFPCFNKSLIGLSSALYLTRSGLWGAARPLIRHAFESLIIAKFCSVDSQSDVFDRWVDGVDLYFGNSVLKKIKQPDVEDFRAFWGLLSDYSHSSIYALQPNFDIEESLDEVELNLAFIEMMMECQYHLLISHLITPSMKYYQARYRGEERANELKKFLNKNYSISKKRLGTPGKAVINNYRRKWIIS